ncbi:MAG: hypothetical protein IJT97_00765 [Bacteroidaceae bacterium]|nr:hypothetical protein [Bacteroidaceae bacterium]
MKIADKRISRYIKTAATHFVPLVCVLSALLLSVACSEEDVPEEPVDKPQYGTTDGRVVLVYMAAENSLASQSGQDLKEILAGVKYLGENDHLIVYIDNTQPPCIYDFTYYCKDTELDSIQPVRTYESDVNSCSPEVLGDVLQYVKQNYPSPSYGLVLWSHASGWIPPVPTPYTGGYTAWGTKRRSFGYDNGQNTQTNSGGQLSIDELRDVLLQFGTVDFLMFDACFMQNIETAYQLRKCARYIVGSPAEIPGPGAPYQTVLKPMFQDSAYVEGVVDAYYNYYLGDYLYGVLLSAVDCDRLEHVAQVTEPYIKAYKEDLLNMDYTHVQDYFWWDAYFMYEYPDFYDMQGIMRAVLTEAEYEQWYTEFQKIFLAQRHTDRWYSAFNRSSNNSVDALQYSGISMHIPLYKYAMRDKWFAPAYYETDWAKAVWGDPKVE